MTNHLVCVRNRYTSLYFTKADSSSRTWRSVNISIFNIQVYFAFFTCIYLQGARHVGTSLVLISTTINYKLSHSARGVYLQGSQHNLTISPCHQLINKITNRPCEIEVLFTWTYEIKFFDYISYFLYNIFRIVDIIESFKFAVIGGVLGGDGHGWGYDDHNGKFL
jgi:hypothetical protein